MLIEDFYTIGSVISEGYSLNATLKLNENHVVYQGHFPNQPVVPGVIQLQIIKELLETNLNKSLQIVHIIQAKYLRPIIPQEYPELEVNINRKKYR